MRILDHISMQNTLAFQQIARSRLCTHSTMFQHTKKIVFRFLNILKTLNIIHLFILLEMEFRDGKMSTHSITHGQWTCTCFINLKMLENNV